MKILKCAHINNRDNATNHMKTLGNTPKNADKIIEKLIANTRQDYDFAMGTNEESHGPTSDSFKEGWSDDASTVNSNTL